MTSPWQPQHHSCSSSSATQAGAYGDLNLKEERCWGVEGGLPRKILNWAEAQRPKSNQNQRWSGRYCAQPKPYSLTQQHRFAFVKSPKWYLFFWVLCFLLSCLAREGDGDSYCSLTKPDIFTINRSPEAAVHRRASRKPFQANHWPLVAIRWTDIMENWGPSHLMAPNMHWLWLLHRKKYSNHRISRWQSQWLNLKSFSVGQTSAAEVAAVTSIECWSEEICVLV